MSGSSAAPSRRAPTAETQLRAGRYARLAAGLLDAPLAAVQLEPGGDPIVHENGSDEPGPHYDAARGLCGALCAQLWYGRTVVAIPDLSRERGVSRGTRAATGLGACIAAPLVGGEGRFLGTIFVADHREREWTDVEIERLRTIAGSLSAEVDVTEVTPAPPVTNGAVGEFVASALGLLEGKRAAPSPKDKTAETMEALQTAVEELQIMNEELQAARYLVELERQHYRELFECVPHPYLITDQDGVIREANDAAVGMLGAKRAYLIGKPLAVFIPEDGRLPFRKRLRDLRSGGRAEWGLQIAPRGRTPLSVECAAAAMRSRESEAERIYWLLREVEGAPEAPETNGAAGGNEALGRAEPFEELIARAPLRGGVVVAEQLRDLIAGALDTGLLQVGQRLPSIRAIADRFQVTSYAALQAYATLEGEGVVERRERSGVYVAAVDWPIPPRLPETADWLAGVLTQACEHQLRIPQLPELVRRWTGSVALRCACVESCADTVAALCHELGSRFGVEAIPVPVGEIVGADGSPRRTSALPAGVQAAHLLVTTPFHASQVRAIAESAGKPLLVATMNTDIVEAVEAHLAEHDLTVVCVDRAAGERLRDLRGGAYRSRIRIVLADELASAGLDRSEPVFLTLAARQRLNGASLRLVTPPTPSFSLDFARKVSGTLLRLNIDAGRG